MTEDSRPRPGSLRSLIANLASLFQTRAELFRIEAQEQQERLVGHLLTGVAAAAAALLSLIALLLFLMVVTPPTWRPGVMGGLAVLFMLSTFGLLRYLARRIAASPPPFDLTLRELKKDWHTLSGKE